MKIVIDISEHIYKQIMADSEVYILDNEVDRILIENAIYNGTPLSERYTNEVLEKIKAELIKYLADYDFGTGYQNDVAMIIDKYIERDEKRTCANCLLDGTDACSRGAGRAIDDRVCEDYLEGVRASDI